MKPQRFEIGQKITPKEKQTWNVTSDPGKNYKGESIPQLKFGEIYTVRAYQGGYPDGKWGIYLVEFGNNFTFTEDRFDPIELTTSDLIKAIEEPLEESVKIVI